MQTAAEINLADLTPPMDGQSSMDWASQNLGEPFGFPTYKDVLRHLNIPINPTQSGIITLQRAIRKARMESGEMPIQVTGEKKAAAPKREVPQTSDPLISLLLDYLRPHLETSVDENQVRQIVQECGIDADRVIQIVGEYLASMDLYKGIRIEGITPEPIVIDGAAHQATPNVLAIIKAGLSVYLHGPAGTGKSKIGEVCATALNLNFYPMSVCAQSTKSDLAGYMDAHGKYVSTIFRKAYEEGGLFLLDEVDNGNANVLNVLNNALANNCMAFPDGMVNKHPDFRCIAAANTFGTGASEQYIGRNALDAAFKDRFVSQLVDYDNELEKHLFGEEFCAPIWAAREVLRGRTGWVLSMRSISSFRQLSQVIGKAQAFQYAISNLSEQHRQAINHIQP